MQGQTHLSVSIALRNAQDEVVQITHWNPGDIAEDGGELMMFDFSPVGGPPSFDYDATGKDRTPKTVTLTTLILGSTAAEQAAFRANFARGNKILAADITGLEPGVNFVIQIANVTHHPDENPSELAITLHEIGSGGDANPAP